MILVAMRFMSISCRSKVGRRLLLFSAAERSLLGQFQCTNPRPAQGVTKTGRRCVRMHTTGWQKGKWPILVDWPF
jgi:hypothetical protein